jgi:sterol desaturase/sphingolipid hydroxylase (fatty acid hydroxylase superfamily)
MTLSFYIDNIIVIASPEAAMPFDAVEAFLRRNDEPLQYAAFFGALALMAALELAAGRGRGRLRRWPANWSLTALNIVLLGALPLSGLAVADLARERGWGLLNHPAVPLGAALVLGFAARSLISYGVHVAMHKIPLLWRVHRVHHSDPALDISSTVRFHPLEFVIQTPVVIAALLVLGIHPLVVIAFEILDAATNVFTHADIRLPRRLERALRLVIVTPEMHRLHHSAAQPETDSNYGAMFSVWDRLFGTLRAGAPAALGLADCDERRARSLGWLLLLPFRGRAARPHPRSVPTTL